jgi:hypothetical protein
MSSSARVARLDEISEDKTLKETGVTVSLLTPGLMRTGRA